MSTEVVDEAYRVGLQVDRRLALSGGATVVALAGATGSGKSSTFNALTGTDLATVGVRRPDHVGRPWPRPGARTRGRSCSTGCRSGAATWSSAARARRAAPWRSTGWCCSTCPTTTRPRPSTGPRSTGWSRSSTCWSGSSTRRSTPTPPCTSATCGRSPGTPR